MIYFIRQDSTVKIGCTKNIKIRLSDLQVSNPHELSVLLLINGSFKEEERLHSLFVDDKVRGEWYFLSDEIKEFIKEQQTNDLRYDEGLSDDLDTSVQTSLIRHLHSLSLKEVGEKMGGISPQSVREQEQRELNETISIKVLRKYGDVLGYDLVYKFIKRKEEE